VCGALWLCGCHRPGLKGGAASELEPKTTSSGQAAPADGSRERCELPPAAPGLVISLAKHVLPQVGPDPTPHVELGQLTDATGVCDADDGACVRTTTADLASCYRDLRQQIGGGFELVPHASVSPHYGGRFIKLSWRGGRCQVGDSAAGKLTEQDARRFDAAYETAVRFLLAARGDAGAP
jgi:hypothetical protein